MSDANEPNSDVVTGPFRPSHARNGWILRGADDKWCLTRVYGHYIGTVTATTPTTCAWTVTTSSGEHLREASCGEDVEAAKRAADEFMGCR